MASWTSNLYRKPFRSDPNEDPRQSKRTTRADDGEDVSIDDVESSRPSQIVPGVANGGEGGKALSIADFEVLSKIGEGGFGTVLLVRKRKTGKLYALKVLVKKNMRRSGDARRAISESAAMQEIKHPFVVTLHFAFQDANHIYFVLEFVGGGDLYSHLERHTFPEEVRAAARLGVARCTAQARGLRGAARKGRRCMGQLRVGCSWGGGLRRPPLHGSAAHGRSLFGPRRGGRPTATDVDALPLLPGQGGGEHKRPVRLR
jgi:S-adenosylmethionine/arginine decarboxylase-like enzyme